MLTVSLYCNIFNTLPTESCHESSALRFVTELGVADVIGGDKKSLSEICEQIGVDSMYLGKYLTDRLPCYSQMLIP